MGAGVPSKRGPTQDILELVKTGGSITWRAFKANGAKELSRRSGLGTMPSHDAWWRMVFGAFQ